MDSGSPLRFAWNDAYPEHFNLKNLIIEYKLLKAKKKYPTIVLYNPSAPESLTDKAKLFMYLRLKKTYSA